MAVSSERGCSLTKGFSDFGGLEAHEVGQLVDDDLPLSGVLVDPLDAPPLPVRPVDEVAEQREAEDVRQLVLQQSHPPRAIDVDHLGQRRGMGCVSSSFTRRAMEATPKHRRTDCNLFIYSRSKPMGC